MTLRLEVGCGQRKPFAWFLRAARRHPSFHYERAGDDSVAILEFDSWAAIAPYFFEVYHRRYARVYRDGALIDRETAMESVYRARGLTRFGGSPTGDANGEAPRTAQMLREVLGAPTCPACGQPLPQ